MLDQSTLKGRIIAAAIRLAAEKPWQEVTLLDIAEAASVKLADIRGEFAGKSEIAAAFARAVDDELLRRAPAKAAASGPRDALFEVIMMRFDILAPYKQALRSMINARTLDPVLVRSFVDSQRWMLEAAGISADGVSGAVRVQGLAAVYASTFRTWLDDDDPGLAKTMAGLDRRLRRAERTYSNLREMRGAIDRIAGMLSPRRRETDKQAGTADPAAGAGGTA